MLASTTVVMAFCVAVPSEPAWSTSRSRSEPAAWASLDDAWGATHRSTPAARAEASSPRRMGWLPRWFHRDSRATPAPPANAARAPARESSAADRPSDALLISRCRAILCADRELRGVVIHVTARDGVLRLDGSVDSPILRDRADRLARRTSGARDVCNELSVRSMNAPWFKYAPVTLADPRAVPSAPGAADGVAAAGWSASALSPAAPPAPMKQAWENASSDPWLTKPTLMPAAIGRQERANAALAAPIAEPVETNDSAAPADPWLAKPTPATPGYAILDSREGLPTVTTYLARRSADPPLLAQAPILPMVAPSTGTEVATASLKTSLAPERWVASASAVGESVVVAPIPDVAVPTTPNGRADIDATLAGMGRFEYEWQDGEIILRGQAPSADTLALVIDRLQQLPNVEAVSYDGASLRLAP